MLVSTAWLAIQQMPNHNESAAQRFELSEQEKDARLESVRARLASFMGPAANPYANNGVRPKKGSSWWKIAALVVVLTVTTFGLVGNLWADSATPYPAVQAECARYLPLSYPDADRPTPEQGGQLANCDAERLYYGIGQAADPVKARLCALTNSEDLAQEAGVLMMVYANGQGVERNYAMAKKAACLAGGAPLELAGRLAHLNDMALGTRGFAPHIDICDDITSGFMQGICADIQSELAGQVRKQKLEALTAGWSRQAQKALVQFQRHADQFFADSSRLEVDQSGTARGAQVIEAEFELQEDWLASLQAFEEGRLPAYSSREYAKLDHELNKRFQALQRRAPSSGTVTFEDIREAQRGWLTYREALVMFGRQKYPTVAAHAWRAFATEKRIQALNELADTW